MKKWIFLIGIIALGYWGWNSLNGGIDVGENQAETQDVVNVGVGSGGEIVSSGDLLTNQKRVSLIFATESGEKSFNVEVAADTESQERGLMYRDRVNQDEGMLFVFRSPRKAAFWMKNVRIPLDMIFIDDQLKVVNVEHNASPCEDDPCAYYYADDVVKYVVELNGGVANRIGLKAGDSIKIEY